MSVTIIKGRSGSGKSRFLMEHINALLCDPFEKIIVIVPGQLTFETEKNIMQSCNVKGIFGLSVFGIGRLAQKILEETSDDSFISNAEAAMICSKALLGMNKPYHGMDKLPEFEVCAADLIRRLKSYNQTPDSIRAAAADIKDNELAAKLFDTADLLEQYISISGGKLDSSDKFSAAAAKASGADFLKGTHVVIDGLDTYCPSALSLISKVIEQSRDTIAAFRSEGEGSDKNLFESEKKDMERFIEAVKKTGRDIKEISAQSMKSRYSNLELDFLEKNLYRYPYEQMDSATDNIQIFEAQDIEHEIDILAANILGQVKAGKRFRDIAVVGGNLETYASAIKSKFALCGIAYFLDERRALSDNSFFDFLYNALCAAAGDMTAVTRYAYSEYAPLDENQRFTLLKYTAKYAYKGWHYFSEFWRGGDAEQAEELRKKAIAPINYLTAGLQEKNARKQIFAIKQFLKMCGAENKLNDFVQSINDKSTRAEYEYFGQVYEKTQDILSGIEQVFGDMQILPETLCGLFKTGCEATKIAVIPPATDEVGIFDISVAKLPDIDVLFAIGVADGIWPAKDDSPGIISSAEADTLKSAGLEIGGYDLAEEKLKIYSALVKPKERLTLSYNTAAGQPSILIDRIKRIFPQLYVQKPEMVKTSISGMGAGILGEIAEVISGKEADERLFSICALFLRQPGWRQNARKMLLRTNGAECLGEDTAAKLYGAIKCSATRIENYNKCPFRHFLDYGLKVQQEKDYTNDKIDIGTYMHLALDIFAKKLIADKADIKKLTEDETRRRMAEAADIAAMQHDNAKLKQDERFEAQFQALRAELINTALRIRRHFAGTCASIHSSEQEFTDYVLPTKLGDVVIRGKIDRIDTAGSYFRIVDYKSSATQFSLSDFASGISLQLPIYISAAKKIMEKDEKLPSGGYYMRIGDVYKDSADEVDKAARMAGISLCDEQVLSDFNSVLPNGSFSAIDQALTKSGKLHGRGKNKYFTKSELDMLLSLTDDMIKKAAEQIYSGNISLTPIANKQRNQACEYCAYSSVCMFNENYEDNESRQIKQIEKDVLLGEACL